MKHNIEAIKNEFEELLEALAPTDIRSFLQHCGDYDSFRRWRNRMRDVDTLTECGCAFACGCSRAVLIPVVGDYVFKFQYDDGDCINYCEQETKVYKAAVERGADKFFAWTECIGLYGGTLIYAMEKVDASTERCSDDSYQYHAERWREENPNADPDECELDGYDDTDGMLDYALACNGSAMEKAIALINDLGINDLHAGNWGYRGTTLVLIDYGGYDLKLDL